MSVRSSGPLCCLASGFWGEQERTTVLQETSRMRVGRTPDGRGKPWSSQSQSQRGGPIIRPTRKDFAHFAVAVLVVSTSGPVCLPSRGHLSTTCCQSTAPINSLQLHPHRAAYLPTPPLSCVLLLALFGITSSCDLLVLSALLQFKLT